MLGIYTDFCDSECQSMLSISGPSGIGKTHLLKRSFEYLKTKDLSYVKRGFSYPIIIINSWERIVLESFKQDVNYLEKLENCGVLLIEDFLSEDANNRFTEAAKEIAYKLINRRVGKKTLIDTNKSESDIINIDIRIHDRLFREGGRFISMKSTTKSYSQRKK